MAKVTFSKLKLNKETEVTKVMIGEVEIEVKHYISITEKILILDTILKEACDFNFVNKAKADALLHIYMILCYTNITITKKERDDLLGTYDLLEKNGVIDVVVATIPENEYGSFVTYCEEVMNDYDKYKNSIVGIVEKVMAELPERLEGVNKLMAGFNPGDLKVLQEAVSKFGGSPAAVTEAILGQK